MPANRFFDPFVQKYRSTTGAVGAGWKLYFYVGGSTTTLQSTYSDINLTTANTNPVVADAAGFFGDIFLDSALSYAVKLTDENDVQIDYADYIQQTITTQVSQMQREVQTGSDAVGQVFTLTEFTYATGDTQSLLVFQNGIFLEPGATADYVETSSSSITVNSSITINPTDKWTFLKNVVAATTDNAANIQYDPAGTGAQATNVQAKLRESVSVLDFGAVGDGVTDDTTAIQAAIDFVVSGLRGGRVFIPTGTYVLSDTIDLYNAGIPAGISIEGENPGGESGNYGGTQFEWQGANDRPVFQSLGINMKGIRFANFLLYGAGTFGSPSNPYQDAFHVGPTSGASGHKIIFENLWIRDFTRTGAMLGDPLGSTYNGQMANSGMYNCWFSGYLPDAKVIWAKGGTSEDFYIYNLMCVSQSGNDKKNFITAESGFYINIYGLLTDGIEDAATSYAIDAYSSVCVYQWVTEDLRIYRTFSNAYGHPIVLSGVRQQSSSGTHGGTVRDAIQWRGFETTINAWSDVSIMQLVGCTFNGNVDWTTGANQSQMSAVGCNFATGGFVLSGTNQRCWLHDTTTGEIIHKGPSVGIEQLDEDGTSRFKISGGATYYRRNTKSDITANTNDYAIGTVGTYFRIGPTGGDWNLTGIADGEDGRLLIISNVSTVRTLTLTHEDVLSTAANRIVTPSAASVAIAPGHHAQLIYDSPSSRWNLINYY